MHSSPSDQLTAQQLERLAHRVHLQLPEHEQSKLLGDIRTITRFLEHRLSVSGESSSIRPSSSHFRKDTPEQFSAREQILSQVPDLQQRYIVVPANSPSQPGSPCTSTTPHLPSTNRARKQLRTTSAHPLNKRTRSQNERILELSAHQLAVAVKEGRLTAQQIAQAFLEQVTLVEPRVQAFLHIDSELVLRQARHIDTRRERGEKLGRLAGVPVALKDALCTHDMPTTCASNALMGSWHSPYDATVVARLRSEDAVLIGKTNMDEFSMGSSTETSAAGPTHNPWDLRRTAGGSSGGSAAAVASRMACLALGSDTGGSLRQPAGFNHLVGVRPTYGRVSRYGLVAMCSSLDQVGPLARDVASAALMLEIIAGPDERDQTTRAAQPIRSRRSRVDMSHVKVGVMTHWLDQSDAEVKANILAALDLLETRGATLLSMELDDADLSVRVYQALVAAEVSSNLARFDGVRFGARSPARADTLEQLYRQARAHGFGMEVTRRILVGTFVLSAGHYQALYERACLSRQRIRGAWADIFSDVDIVVAPTTPTIPWLLGQGPSTPVDMYLADKFTVPASLAGLPAVTVPCAEVSNSKQGSALPVGMQFIAAPWRDDWMLDVAFAWEQIVEEEYPEHHSAPTIG